MKLFVGLGNPDKKYELNRHNVGFMLIDKLGLDFKENSDFNCLLAKDTDNIYIKPLTFMNNSGEAISKVANFYKISVEDITILHDDVDLDFGQIKKQLNAGAAGHHGVENIIEKLGTQNFWRIRFGVGKPTNSQSVEKFVLDNFTSQELEFIKNLDLSLYLS